MPRERRVVTSCKVEYERVGTRIEAVSEDLSRHGCFVRTWQFLPIGAVVELTLHLPGDAHTRIISRVAHILSESAARALGRQPGMGFEFLDPDPDRRARLEAMLQELITELTPPPQVLPIAPRALVIDSSTKILERLSTALGSAGFQVAIAANGAEGYSSALESPPDVILCADDMPVMDGWTLVRMLATRPRLADIPVALMSEDPSDMTRLRAYRLGVRDFVLKPFTDEEVAIRLHRLAAPERHDSERVILRGSIGEIGIATLLSLLEFERKSGVLAVLRDADVARMFIAAGRVVKIETSVEGIDAKARLLRVLDWGTGNFEFVSAEIVGQDEVGATTSHLLIEHARLSDEEAEGAKR